MECGEPEGVMNVISPPKGWLFLIDGNNFPSQYYGTPVKNFNACPTLLTPISDIVDDAGISIPVKLKRGSGCPAGVSFYESPLL
jgi:hypothetical protein